MRFVVHMLLHVAVPLAAARLGWPDRWRRAWLTLLATMAVDVDHLLADPIFDPTRCSLGHHPLHQAWAIAIYGLLLLPARTRLVAVGLLIHMALDGLDCVWMRAGG